MTILIHFTDSDNILEIDSSSSSTDIQEARNVINQEFSKIENIRATSFKVETVINNYLNSLKQNLLT